MCLTKYLPQANQRMSLLHDWKTKFFTPALSQASEIVEIGPGKGTNFIYMSPGTIVHAIEPDTDVNKILEKRASDKGIVLNIHNNSAENLSVFPDESLETILSTRSLCAIPDLDKALTEIYRKLKPGGVLHFMEHVRAPKGTRLALLQNIFSPLWKLVSKCELNRDIQSSLLKNFDQVEIRHFSLTNWSPLYDPLHWPHIAGHAYKTNART